MKRIAVFVALLFAASLAQAKDQAQTQSKTATGITEEKPIVVELVDPKTAPTAKVLPKKLEKKIEVIPTIPGVNITRPNGTYLGLEVVGGNFKLSFYDKKKKPMAVDVTRATAKWPNPRSPGDNRTVLNGSGTALIGAKPVVPPFTFNVFITLLQGEGEEAKAVETYVVQLRG